MNMSPRARLRTRGLKLKATNENRIQMIGTVVESRSQTASSFRCLRVQIRRQCQTYNYFGEKRRSLLRLSCFSRDGFIDANLALPVPAPLITLGNVGQISRSARSVLRSSGANNQRVWCLGEVKQLHILDLTSDEELSSVRVYNV